MPLEESEIVNSWSGCVNLEKPTILRGDVVERVEDTLERVCAQEDGVLYDYDALGLPNLQEPKEYTNQGRYKALGIEQICVAPNDSVGTLFRRCLEASGLRELEHVVLSTSNDLRDIGEENPEVIAQIERDLSGVIDRIDITGYFCAGLLTSMMSAAQQATSSRTLVGYATSEKLSEFFPRCTYPSKDVLLLSDGAALGAVGVNQPNYRLTGVHIQRPDATQHIVMTHQGIDGNPLITLPGKEKIMKAAADGMYDVLAHLCASANVDLSSVAFIGFHQGSRGVTNRVKKIFTRNGISEKQLHVDDVALPILAKYGNMGGTTIAHQMCSGLEYYPDEPIALLSVGKGYNLAGVLLEPIN